MDECQKRALAVMFSELRSTITKLEALVFRKIGRTTGGSSTPPEASVEGIGRAYLLLTAIALAMGVPAVRVTAAVEDALKQSEPIH